MKANLIAFTKVPNGSDTFNLQEALDFCAKMGGICYAEDGFEKLSTESSEVTAKRLNRVLTSGHHSVFDHFRLTFEFYHIPKIIAMILNNEKDYATSEKSARYTHFENLPGEQGKLYEKWCDKLVPIIEKAYPCLVNEKAKDPYLKIKKLAQENARYFVSIFEPVTTMGYTVSLRQLNYLLYMFEDYIKTAEDSNFNKLVVPYMKKFVSLFDEYRVDDLIPKGKNRRLSLFGDKAYDRDDIKEIYSYVYQTTYWSSFSCQAQNHRHRSEHSFIYVYDDFKFYVPEIIRDDEALVNEWLEDAEKVKDIFPQGKLVKVFQTGNIDTLILKCRERACSCAQLEVMQHSTETLKKISENSEYAEKILEETNGQTARCKFKGYKCTSPCVFGAKQAERKI